MTGKPVTRRGPAGAPGAKILITASALVATLAGWAGLTAKEAAASLVQDQAPSEAALSLAPLPTLVPQPTWTARALSGSAPPTVSRPALRRVSAPAPVTVTRSSR